jgi:hypothetical protein
MSLHRKTLARDTILAMRNDYATRELSVHDICVRYDVCAKTLCYWVDGGPPTGAMHFDPIPRRRDGVARRGRRRPLTGNRLAVIRRLWRTAEAQVAEIEDRLARDPGAPEERERDARTLAVVAKTLRELRALEDSKPGAARRAAQADNDDDPMPQDINEFRFELARRINKLVESRTGAGSADGGDEPMV